MSYKGTGDYKELKKEYYLNNNLQLCMRDSEGDNHKLFCKHIHDIYCSFSCQFFNVIKTNTPHQFEANLDCIERNSIRLLLVKKD